MVGLNTPAIWAAALLTGWTTQGRWGVYWAGITTGISLASLWSAYSLMQSSSSTAGIGFVIMPFWQWTPLILLGIICRLLGWRARIPAD